MILAIDIGGTKVLAATFTSDGKILHKTKFKTPKDYQDFLTRLKSELHALMGGKKPTSCAIAMPGKVDREEGVGVSFGNLPWKNIRLRDDLSDTISCKIHLENDAKAAALAEADSVKEDYDRALYVTVSTGIGWGLVVNGKLDLNVSDGGGKSFKVEHDGKVVPWESFASGKAIVEKYGKLASELEDSGAWHEISRNLAIRLNELNELLSPDCIIVGGGAGANLDKFKDHLVTEMEIYANALSNPMPTILKAQHPEEAVIYGCYLLCNQHAT